MIVLTPEGVKVGSSYNRLQDGRGERQAWQTSGWKELRGLPWDVAPRARTGHRRAALSAAGQTEAPATEERGAGEAAAPVVAPLPAATIQVKETRGTFPVQKRFIEKYGCFPGCAGCNWLKYPIGNSLPMMLSADWPS